MKCIYFVRHSIRDFSIKKDMEAPLTLKGIELANELANYFKDKNINKIYSSPYLRTIQTIEPTANLLNINITPMENLKERVIGEWVENFQEFSSNQWNDFKFKLENEESLKEVQHRMQTAYKEVLNDNSQNIIICGHSTSLAVLFNSILEENFGIKELEKMKMPDIYLGKYNKESLIEFNQIDI